jgi:hypothetical protein
VADFHDRAPSILAALDAQGWTNMVEDHCPMVIEFAWEFCANLHKRCSDSF